MVGRRVVPSNIVNTPSVHLAAVSCQLSASPATKLLMSLGDTALRGRFFGQDAAKSSPLRGRGNRARLSKNLPLKGRTPGGMKMADALVGLVG